MSSQPSKGERTTDPLSAPPDDGLVDREAGPWTRDKLAILWCYMGGFCTACSRKAHQWFYVDAFAGPGVNSIRQTRQRAGGSPLLALAAVPPFTRCLFVDVLDSNVRTLAARTGSFGDRAVVRRGNCNRDLIGMMNEWIDPGYPTLCLFDPEGAELQWSTIEGVARFRTGARKVEQLILFQVDGLARVMPLYTQQWAEERLGQFWGHDRWKTVLERRQTGLITADQARTEYLALYADGLRRLGYSAVLNREIRERSRAGRLKYFLLFATDHPVGATIMNHCFDNVFLGEQGVLFEVPLRRDLPGD